MTGPVKNRRASESAPEAGYRLHPDTPIETTEQLRIAIDQGHAGDKVDVTDPAAAPLGTDDEAGGSPNTVAQVRLAAADEVHARPSSASQRSSGWGAAWWLIGYSVLTGASIVASAIWIVKGNDETHASSLTWFAARQDHVVEGYGSCGGAENTGETWKVFRVEHSCFRFLLACRK